MFNTAIVEVAIGLIFIFSLLAILVTQINTFFANILKLRSKELRNGLDQLVKDERLRAEMLAHPLINMVDKSAQVRPQGDALRVSAQTAEDINTGKLPLNNITYIAPGTFVEALISLLFVRSGGNIFERVRDTITLLPDRTKRIELYQLLQHLELDPSEERMRTLEAAISTVPNNADLRALVSRLKGVLEVLDYRTNELSRLLNGVAQIDNQAFREAVGVILATAKNLDDARLKLENWFNDGMNRASNLYKRNLQLMSLAVALVLAIALNIDTLHLAQSLWQDPDLRRTVVATARRLDPEMVNPTTESEAAAPNDTGEDVTLDDLEADVDDIGTTVQKLLELQLPIGWEYTVVTQEMINLAQEIGLPDPRTNTRNLWNLLQGDLGLIIQKILGILATTIAAAQGAPFWFDLLNRFAGRKE